MSTTPLAPQQILEDWRRQTPEWRPRLVQSIREETAARGFSRVVLGLSGGLDSTVTAALCVEALRAENVLAVLMPHRTTSPGALSLSQGVVNALGITSRRVNMSPVLDSYFANFPDANRNRRGLCVTWQRVGVLLDLGHHYGACVVQALNRSDRLFGYGEGPFELASALRPLAGLYKTQVQQLAEAMNALGEVRSRRPSLEYWAGQTDETDLGHPYAVLDPLAHALVDRGEEPGRLVAAGHSKAAVDWAVQRLKPWCAVQRLTPPVELPRA